MALNAAKSSPEQLKNFFLIFPEENIALTINQGAVNFMKSYSELIDTLLDNGVNFDENIAREAIEDALASFYKKCSENQNFKSLEHLTEEQLKRAIEDFVSGYIYKRWLQKLGNCIERKAVSEIEAVKLEGEVKIYVRDLVNLELDSRNILSIDWNGDEGRQMIDSLYEDAYSLIEEG